VIPCRGGAIASPLEKKDAESMDLQADFF